MDRDKIPLGNYVIGGIAFAGRHGISKVQLSLDDGKSWNDAETKEPLSKWSWILWRFDWRPFNVGAYAIKVRGIDRSGNVQESVSLLGSIFRSSFPDGAKGLHEISATVRKKG